MTLINSDPLIGHILSHLAKNWKTAKFDSFWKFYEVGEHQGGFQNLVKTKAYMYTESVLDTLVLVKSVSFNQPFSKLWLYKLYFLIEEQLKIRLLHTYVVNGSWHMAHTVIFDF